MIEAQLTDAEWDVLQAARARHRAGGMRPRLRPSLALSPKEDIDQLINGIREHMGSELPRPAVPADKREAGQAYIFGYGRASTPKQKTSIEVQREELTKWANKQKDPLMRVRLEHISGKSVPFFERPEGHKLRLELERGDTLVIHKLDRLGRKLKDMLNTID